MRCYEAMRGHRRGWLVAGALVVFAAACTGFAARPQHDDAPRDVRVARDVGRSAEPVARVRATALRRYGTAADPLRVLVWGDSVAVTFEPVVQAALTTLRDRAGPSVMLPAAALGFGLSSPYAGILNGAVTAPNFTDWQSRLDHTLQAERPDEVVVLIGTWDVLPRNVGGTWLQPGSPQWQSWYEGLVADTARRITASGAHLTWLTHPCVTDPSRNRFLPAVNAVYRAVAARRPAVDVVDLAGLACPGGRFDPATRTPEGTHFALSAVTRLTPSFAAQLARAWRLPPS
jgi:lysophospholipase L1-like esterase